MSSTSQLKTVGKLLRSNWNKITKDVYDSVKTLFIDSFHI